MTKRKAHWTDELKILNHPTLMVNWELEMAFPEVAALAKAFRETHPKNDNKSSAAWVTRYLKERCGIKPYASGSRQEAWEDQTVHYYIEGEIRWRLQYLGLAEVRTMKKDFATRW